MKRRVISKRVVRCLPWSILWIGCLWIGSSGWAAQTPGVERVTVTATAIEVSGRWPNSIAADEICLVELAPHLDADQLDRGRNHPLSETSGPVFRWQTDRWDDDSDRLFSRWCLARQSQSGLEMIGSIHWAQPTREAARYANLEPAQARTIKGLGGIHPDPRLYDDLVELGVGHITVNLMLNSVLAAGPNEPSPPDSIDDGSLYRFQGKTYRMRTAALTWLDQLLAFAQQHQIVVSAIILVPRLDRDSSLGELLTHPDASDGHYSMANVTSADGWEAYAACLSFLAERYGPPQTQRGRIHHWIIHNEVDAGWVWTNAGEKSAVEYMQDYLKSMRIASLAVRCFDPHAQVFISLTHHWAVPHQPNPRRYYPSRELLEILARSSREEGDFAWGVAFHPYPQDLFNPRTWNDDQARDDFDTPSITFKNLQVLERWLQQDRYLNADGEVRTVFLSEQGFHTVTEDASGEALQAAALAYAWKKIEQVPSIRAFHYHRWIDHEREGGLRLGLWTVEPGSITWPQNKKRSWEVFRALGTDREDDVLRFALPIIGISSWDELDP